MEQGRLLVVVKEQEEVLAEGEEVVAGWEEHVPEPGQAAIVFVPVVAQRFLIREEPPAIT